MNQFGDHFVLPNFVTNHLVISFTSGDQLSLASAHRTSNPAPSRSPSSPRTFTGPARSAVRRGLPGPQTGWRFCRNGQHAIPVVEDLSHSRHNGSRDPATLPLRLEGVGFRDVKIKIGCWEISIVCATSVRNAVLTVFRGCSRQAAPQQRFRALRFVSQRLRRTQEKRRTPPCSASHRIVISTSQLPCLSLRHVLRSWDTHHACA